MNDEQKKLVAELAVQIFIAMVPSPNFYSTGADRAVFTAKRIVKKAYDMPIDPLLDGTPLMSAGDQIL